MKTFFYLILTFLTTTLISQTAFPELKYTQELTHNPTMGCCPANPPTSSDYQVVFRDDFDGTSLNTTEWQTDFLWDNNHYIGENNAEPFYVGGIGENIFVENGILKLKVDNLIPNQTVNGKAVKYSMGQVWSKKKFRYGKFECKFKLPEGNTGALYPAIWMQNDTYYADSRDEIDMIEAYGYLVDNNASMEYGCGSLNSVAGSWECYQQNVGYQDNHVPLTPGAWHIVSMERTPYFMIIKLDGTVIHESYRYYKVCDGEKTPFKCNEEVPACVGEQKFIENMAFTDDYMNLCINLTLQPTTEWWGIPIAETNTDIPAFFEIDYIQVEQPATGTWGDCENKMFCTYSVINQKDDIINICSTENAISPNQFVLYPKASSWVNNVFSHSNNINAVIDHVYLQGDDNVAVTLNPNYPTNELAWFQFQIPENANSTCIGQDRIFKKTLQFNELGSSPLEVLLDNNYLLEYDKIYLIKKGLHSIKIQSPNDVGLVNEISITNTVNNITQTFNSNEVLYDFLVLGYSRDYKIKIKISNEICSIEKNYSILCECNDMPEMYINNNMYANGEFWNHTAAWYNDPIEFCYGQHTFSFENGWQLISAFDYTHQINLSVNNNTIIINASSQATLFDVHLKGPDGCIIVYTMKIIGMCCLPDHSCNGNCVLEAYPNPANQYLMMGAPPTRTTTNGNTYAPVIRQINVYDKYMQQVKTITPGDVINYNLNVMDLNNNEFYIVETKDQYGNPCRKTVMISR